MKIIIYLLAGLGVFCSIVLGLFALSLQSKFVDEVNRNKTAPARANRWAKKEEEVKEVEIVKQSENEKEI